MLTKRKKKVVIITAATLCIMAVIVASVSMYVYKRQKSAYRQGIIQRNCRKYHSADKAV